MHSTKCLSANLTNAVCALKTWPLFAGRYTQKLQKHFDDDFDICAYLTNEHIACHLLTATDGAYQQEMQPELVRQSDRRVVMQRERQQRCRENRRRRLGLDDIYARAPQGDFDDVESLISMATASSPEAQNLAVLPPTLPPTQLVDDVSRPARTRRRPIRYDEVTAMEDST